MKEQITEIYIVPMSSSEARQAVETIRGHLGDARRLIYDLYQRDGWKALGYKSWAGCVTEEFEESRQHLYRQLDAAKVESVLSPIGDNIGAIPESQLRPFAPLRDEPEEVKKIWNEVNSRTNGHPTAKAVQAAVDEVITSRTSVQMRTFPAIPTTVDDDENDESDEEEEEEESPASTTRPVVPVPQRSSVSKSIEVDRSKRDFLRCLNDIDNLTRTVAARVKDGGYGGLPAVLKLLDSYEKSTVRGTVETLIERLQKWHDSIPGKIP